jgi:FkbM family methyltransferase
MMLHKINNLKLINVIDVGAFVGDFSQSISKSHSEANIFSIEANPNCEAHLKSKSLKYKICCLSDQQKTLDFYIQDDVDVCSGASYYKENTKHYSKSRSIKVNTETLDNLNLFSQEEVSLLKLDTQGSEIDIINGGKNTLKRCKYVLIETSLYEYNKGAPLIEEVFDCLCGLGFSATKVMEQNAAGNIIFQIDFLFKNNNLNI